MSEIPICQVFQCKNWELAEKADKKPCADCDKTTGTPKAGEKPDAGEDVHATRQTYNAI